MYTQGQFQKIQGGTIPHISAQNYLGSISNDQVPNFADADKSRNTLTRVTLPTPPNLFQQDATGSIFAVPPPPRKF